MIDPQKDIDFSLINNKEFEVVCFELLWRNGFKNLKWRGATDDQGRDIEATLEINNPLVGQISERWHFECKKYSGPVPKTALNDKIAWADANNPDTIVFLISSHISNQTRDWLNKLKKNKPYRILTIEGDELKRLIGNLPDLIGRYFNSGNLGLIRNLMKNWLFFDSEPNTQELKHLLTVSDFKKMSDSEIIYLLFSAFIAQNRIFESDEGVLSLNFELIFSEFTNRVGRKTKSFISKCEQFAITHLHESRINANKKEYHFRVSNFSLRNDSDFFTGLHCVIGEGEWWSFNPRYQEEVDAGFEFLLFQESNFDVRMRIIKSGALNYLKELDKKQISIE